jgi:N-acetylglutamate synthase-like GNAT family acetyltransferase
LIPIPKNKVTLRQATLADVDAISALTDAAYSKYIPLIGRKPLPMTADYSRMVIDNTIWSLYVDDHLAGVLVLEYEPKTMLIYSVAIQPEYQKQGLGLRLLDWAEGQALKAGYQTIRLYTNELFTYNINLYLSLGYQETSREPMLNSTLVHMSKNLASR